MAKKNSLRGKNSGPAVTLKIPRPLYQHLAKLIEHTGFRSVTEFAIHILRDVASCGKLEEKPTARLNDQEIDLVRKRLRALGYID